MTVAWVMASGTKRELRSAVSNHREGTLPGNSSLSTKFLRSTKLVTVTNFGFKIGRLTNFSGFKSIRRYKKKIRNDFNYRDILQNIETMM